MRRWSADANSTNSSSSFISDNISSVSSHVVYSGFIVDVVQELLREIPVDWQVDTRQSGRRRTADFGPVRRVLAGVRYAAQRCMSRKCSINCFDLRCNSRYENDVYW